MDQGRGMKSAGQMVTDILDAILPRPELATVREELVTGAVMVVVTVPPSQAQFAIGRSGNNADAIRSLLKAWSGLNKTAAYLKVVDGSESETRESYARTNAG